MIGDLRRLWQLWRARHENPLYGYFKPWRRPLGAVVYTLSWLPLVLVLPVTLFLAFNPEFGKTGPGSSDAIEAAMASLLLLVPLMPLHFLLLARRPWARERCTDIALSRLTSSEVAFGFLWWPLLATSALVLGQLQLFFVLLGTQTLRLDERLIFTALYLVMMLCAVVCTFEMIALRSWWRWLVMILAPAKGLLFLIPIILAVILIGEEIRGLVARQVGATVLMIVILIWLRGRFALITSGLGARLLHAGMPERAVQQGWLRRELATWLLPRHGLSAFCHLVRAWAPALVIEIPMLLFPSLGLWAWMVASGSGPDNSPPREEAIIAAGAMLLPLFVCLSVWVRTLHRRQKRMPVQSGALLASGLLHALPPVCAVALSLIVTTFPEEHIWLDDWAVAGLIGVLPLLLVIGMVAALLLLVARGRVALTLAVIALTPVGVYVVERAVSVRTDDIIKLAIGLGLCSLFFIEWSLLRLFKAETYDVPLGRLTTDDNCGLPFMSDELIDRLTAEAEGR